MKNSLSRSDCERDLHESSTAQSELRMSCRKAANSTRFASLSAAADQPFGLSLIGETA